MKHPRRAGKATDTTCYSLPLRRELRAILHFLNSHAGELRTGLDAGFTNAGISGALRALDGYWMTVETSRQRRELVGESLNPETVLVIGTDGELPFEDKQFDAIVLAHGILGEAMAERIVTECHRVLKTGGLLIFTVEYRKRFGLAAALNRHRPVSDSGGCYTEYEIFELMKSGFDMLGFRSSCRFWVQLVRQWNDRRRQSGVRGMNNGWLRCVYGLAWMADLPLFWTRGHQMTVCGRRKGWRGRRKPSLEGAVAVSDAVLFNPRATSKSFDLQKFR